MSAKRVKRSPEETKRRAGRTKKRRENRNQKRAERLLRRWSEKPSSKDRRLAARSRVRAAAVAVTEAPFDVA